MTHFRWSTDGGISTTGEDCYELNTGCYAVYGFEYKPGFVDDKAVRAFFSRPPGLRIIT